MFKGLLQRLIESFHAFRYSLLNRLGRATKERIEYARLGVSELCDKAQAFSPRNPHLR
jgi:hypothetical protein